MQKEDTRNTIIFVVCAMLLLAVYQLFIIQPQAEKQKAEQARKPVAAAPVIPQAPRIMTRDAAVLATPRVPIETPALKGSLSLRGGRIDDLFLVKFRQKVAKDSPAVELLRPEGAQHPWFAEIGWIGANIAGLPRRDTMWTLAQGSKLAPGAPVTLTYTNGAGLTFTRQIAVDDKYMFTITDTVANATPQAITLAPYGSVQRQGLPTDLGKNSIVHEGGVGWMGDELRLLKYGKWQKDSPNKDYPSTGGWVGVTDKYWLAALIPGQTERYTGQFRTTAAGSLKIYEADFVGQQRTIPSGRQITETTHFFAGAKEVPLLRAYEQNLGVKSLDQSVDWGMFWFLTRPIFSFLAFIQQHVGSFGISILLLTVVVRAIFFPIANKQYESLTKMKKVQPQMEELRKKHKDDPAKQQQELLALYQREKVNPLAGCLPLLLQIPVFFALYKVLTVTLEMRHAPFLGWIKDLSAPDPTNVWNLFGLIPWNPGSVPLLGGLIATAPDALAHAPLQLGVVAIAYGVTMWLTTSMSPPAPDPTQQMIFKLMPLIFTFIMAGFPVGLLIYWTWSNVLTCLQQYVIMRRFKVDNPIDRLIRRFTGAPAPTG